MKIRKIKDNKLSRNTPECVYRSAVFQITLIPSDDNVRVVDGEYKVTNNGELIDYEGDFVYTLTGAKYAPVGTYKHTENGKTKNKRLVSQKVFTSVSSNNGFVSPKDLTKDGVELANYKEVFITKSSGSLGSVAYTINKILKYWETEGNYIDPKQVTIILPHNNLFEALLTDDESAELDKLKEANFKSGLIASNMAFYLHRIAYDLPDDEFILVDGDTLFGQAVRQPTFLYDIKYLAIGLDNTKGNNPMGKSYTTCYGFKAKDFSLIGILRNDSAIRRLTINKDHFELTEKPKTKDKVLLKAYTTRMKLNVEVQPLLQALEWESALGKTSYKLPDGETFETHDRIWVNIPNLYAYDTQLDILFGKALRHIKHRGSKYMLATSSGKAILFNPRRTRLTRLELEKMNKRFSYVEENDLFTSKASRKLYTTSGKQIMCCPQVYRHGNNPFGYRVIIEPGQMMDTYKMIEENDFNYKVRATVKESFKGKPILVQWYIHLNRMLTHGYTYDISLTHGCFARPIDLNKMSFEIDKKCLKESNDLDEIKNKDKRINYTGE